MKKKHFIDTHKAATAPFIICLMFYFDAFENSVAWIYLSLHGTYTLLWLIKSRVFPDHSWEQKTTIGYGLLLLLALSLYWIAPVIIVIQPPAVDSWSLCLSIAVYSFGLFFHFVSDMQKFLQLKQQPGRLIVDGLWARTRNPNYFGELLIYAGFISLARHWIPVLALGIIVVSVFIPNMIKKDRSLSRYPDFAEYKEKSKLFVPYVI